MSSTSTVACGQRVATAVPVAVGKRRRIRHGVALVGAVQSGVGKQFIELCAVRGVDDLLEGHQIRVDAT
jgi:hypothetical protein